MGHADYSNLSLLFKRLLYARGTLTIGEAVAVAVQRGEKLRASEGDYDDPDMIGMALEEYCCFLTRDQRSARRHWGWNGPWNGPFIYAQMRLMAYHPGDRGWEALQERAGGPIHIPPDYHALYRACLSDVNCDVRHGAFADWIEERWPVPCFLRWAEWVRDFPKLLRHLDRWLAFDEDTTDDWELTERIPWRYFSWHRNGYRDVPCLGNVTH